jgi:hypothetical protein
MAEAPRLKHSISDPIAFFLICIAVLFDIFKLLLLALVIIPGLGIGVDVIGSPVISMLEDGIEFVVLYFSGAFKGPGGVMRMATMIGTSGTGLLPVVDDFPLTTMTVIWIIWGSRKADKKRFAEETAAHNARMQQEEMIQQGKLLAQQDVVDRMTAARELGREFPRAPANDS